MASVERRCGFINPRWPTCSFCRCGRSGQDVRGGICSSAALLVWNVCSQHRKKKQHFYLLPHNRFCVCKSADLTFVCSQALGGKVTLKIRTFNSEVSVCSTSSIHFFLSSSSSLVFLAVSVPLSFFFPFTVQLLCITHKFFDLSPRLVTSPFPLLLFSSHFCPDPFFSSLKNPITTQSL